MKLLVTCSLTNCWVLCNHNVGVVTLLKSHHSSAQHTPWVLEVKERSICLRHPTDLMISWFLIVFLYKNCLVDAGALGVVDSPSGFPAMSMRLEIVVAIQQT